MGDSSLGATARSVVVKRLLLLILVCFIAGTSFEALSVERRSIVVLPETAYDFGSVAQGAVVTHDFEIRNEGSADLQIQRIAPSCGCTAATVASPLVGPGKSEKIRVQFDTTGFTGKKFKQIHIRTTDKDRSDIVFTLRGTIVADVRVEPNKLDFGEISPSSSAGSRQKELSLELAKDSDLRVVEVTSSSQAIKVIEGSKRQRTSRYKVEILPSVKLGDLRERIIVRFVDDKKPPLNIPVLARVVGDVSVTPATVSFGVISGSQPIERRVQWRNLSVKPVRIVEVSTSDSAVTARGINIQPGKAGIIVLTLDPTRASQGLKASVTLTTDLPDEPEIVIGVYGVRPPQK